MPQQPALPPQVPAVADQVAIAADHPVAGHQDAEVVAAIGHAGRADALFVAEPAGEFEVGNRLAIGDPAQLRPDFFLEFRAALGGGQVEIQPRTGKVCVQLLHGRQQYIGLHFGGRTSGAGPSFRVHEKDGLQRRSRGAQLQRTDGRRVMRRESLHRLKIAEKA